MRSKVAQEILAETPEETRIFVRQYADIVVRINELLLQKGYTQNYGMSYIAFSTVERSRMLRVFRSYMPFYENRTTKEEE
ncbi:hypothetical protein [Parapedobacter koreensis]|uniref:Uncharacterized protein n=1 Tax=Parapedobacter koreensis TaxID=332977 RepID=A0A1H7GV11_9SPHI|nr:hypothetical protein [Parapedobacter koreensis]SEK41918.1 hypothetical protein SAMN05421740_101812 [Parapedobacter koreensis]